MNCIEKKAFVDNGGNKGPDQPAHLRRLILAFVARSENQGKL